MNYLCHLCLVNADCHFNVSCNFSRYNANNFGGLDPYAV